MKFIDADRDPAWVWNVRKLDEHARIDCAGLDKLVVMLTRSNIKGERMRGTLKRIPRGADLENLTETMRVVLTNLFLAWRAHPRRGVRLSLSAEDYRPALAQYRNSAISLRHMRAVLKQLAATQLIHLDTGRREVNLQTRIFTERRLAPIFASFEFDSDKYKRPAPKRIRSEAPLIRMKKKVMHEVKVTIGGASVTRRKGRNVKVAFTPTAQTERWEANLTRINRHLAAANINLLLTDRQLDELNRWIGNRAVRQAQDSVELQDEDDEIEVENLKNVVDFNDIRLYRSFNNERWDNGGRFYGGWWQGIPKEKYDPASDTWMRKRKYITINNQRTVEVDYSGLHVVMLYARFGLTYDQTLPQNADAYFDQEWFGNDYTARDMHRPFFKKVWQRMLNAKGSQRPEEEWNDIPPGWTIKMAEEHLKAKHPQLVAQKVFHSGIGVELQYDDSRVAEAILLRLLRQKVVVLPIHNSFIVQMDHELALREAMIEEYKKVLGLDYAPEKVTFEDHLQVTELKVIKGWYDLRPRAFNGYVSRGGNPSIIR